MTYTNTSHASKWALLAALMIAAMAASVPAPTGSLTEDATLVAYASPKGIVTDYNPKTLQVTRTYSEWQGLINTGSNMQCAATAHTECLNDGRYSATEDEKSYIYAIMAGKEERYYISTPYAIVYKYSPSTPGGWIVTSGPVEDPSQYSNVLVTMRFHAKSFTTGRECFVPTLNGMDLNTVCTTSEWRTYNVSSWVGPGGTLWKPSNIPYLQVGMRIPDTKGGARVSSIALELTYFG